LNIEANMNGQSDQCAPLLDKQATKK